MKTFNETYLQMLSIPALIYEWNEQLLLEQADNISKLYSENKQIKNKLDLSLDCIYESTYFSNIDDVFETWLSSIYDKLFEEIKQAKSNNEIPEFSTFISIAEIAKHLPKHKIKNYKNFHNFIDVLKTANGQLEIKFDIANYYSPPIEWTEDKLYIKDLPNVKERLLLGSTLDTAGEQYKSYMLELTKKEKTLKEKYQKIKSNIVNQYNFGCIGINGKYFTQLEKFKKNVITHEFEHLLDYLIKINAENWNIGKEYRSKIVHNDFMLDPNGNFANEDDYIAYLLDEKEFKPLSETFIEQLKILFLEHYSNPTENDKKRFLSHVFEFCEIPVRFTYKKSKQNEETQMYLKDFNILSNYHMNKLLKAFVFYNWKDSLSENENSSRNKWTIFKKWIKNEFQINL